jgi:hypothetical protein
MANLVSQHSVRAESTQVHVAADADQLWPRQVVKCQIILEDLANLDDVLRSGRLSSRLDLAEKLGKFCRLSIRSTNGKSGLLERLS